MTVGPLDLLEITNDGQFSELVKAIDAELTAGEWEEFGSQKRVLKAQLNLEGFSDNYIVACIPYLKFKYRNAGWADVTYVPTSGNSRSSIPGHLLFTI